MKLDDKQLQLLNYVENKEAYAQYLTARGNSQVVYLLQLNKAIDSDKNTVIVRRDPHKNKVIISYDKYQELLAAEQEALMWKRIVYCMPFIKLVTILAEQGKNELIEFLKEHIDRNI